MAVYLLHFSKPLSHARHYMGFSESVDTIAKRIETHDAKLTIAAKKAGITFTLARVWPDGDRNFERKLKNQKKGPKLCPICTRKIRSKVPHA